MFNTLRSLGLKLLSLRSLIILSVCLYYFVASASIDADPRLLADYKTTLTIGILSLFLVFFALHHRPITKLLSTRSAILTFIAWLALILVIQQPSLIFMLVIVMTFYDKDYKKMTGYLFIWLSLLFIAFTVLASYGAISSGESLKSNLLVDSSEYQTVTSLGMGNPNTPMAFLLGIIMSGAYVFYDSKYKNRYGILMIIASLGVYSLVGSRTGLICAIVFLTLYLLDSRKVSLLLKSLMPYIMLALLALSIFVGYHFGRTDNIVNNLLTTRPYQWHLRLDSGALTNLIGNSDHYFTVAGDESARYPLDNQYIYTLARYGWLTLITAMSIYFMGLRKNKSPIVTYMIFISIVQCFVESLMFMAVTNIGLLFILSSLMLRDHKKERV